MALVVATMMVAAEAHQRLETSRERHAQAATDERAARERQEEYREEQESLDPADRNPFHGLPPIPTDEARLEAMTRNALGDTEATARPWAVLLTAFTSRATWMAAGGFYLMVALVRSVVWSVRALRRS
jgi:hypothetical protein